MPGTTGRPGHPISAGEPMGGIIQYTTAAKGPKGSARFRAHRAYRADCPDHRTAGPCGGQSPTHIKESEREEKEGAGVGPGGQTEAEGRVGGRERNRRPEERGGQA